MCLIAKYGPGVYVDDRALLNAAEVNDEGFGYAIADKDGLSVWKDVCGPLQAVARFLLERESRPDSHAVFHARLSTGSAATVENLHPFQVDGDPLTVLVHNGTFPYASWAQGEDESDTALFAAHTVPAMFSDLDDAETFAMMEQWMTPANKVAFITVNPRYKKHAYLTHEGLWITDSHGAKYSNRDFEGKGTGWDEETDGNGDLWRFNLPDRSRLRNETQRRAKVAAAARKG